MPGSVKIGGTFKTVAQPSVKVGGAWKSVSAGFTRIGGEWKQWFASILPWSWATQDYGTAVFATAGIYAPLANASYFFFRNGNGSSTATNAYSYSTDGTTWVDGTLPQSVRAAAAAFDGTTLVITNARTQTPVLTTTNGTTWTTRTTPAIVKYDVIWDGTRFLMTAESTTQGLLHSTDGSTWTAIDAGPALWKIGFDGTSRYIALQFLSSSTSTTRTNTGNPTTAGDWSDLTLPASRIWVNVIYAAGTWVIFANDTNYITSTDGTTWTQRTLPTVYGNSNGTSSNQEDYLNSVHYDGDYFYYFLDGDLRRSADAITWEITDSTAVSTSLDNILGWAAGPDLLIGAGIDTRTTGSDIILKGTR